MKIAIFGATSQIAKDLIISFFNSSNDFQIVMFSRSPGNVTKQFSDLNIEIPYVNAVYADFKTDDNYDVIINFVGVGDPAKAKEMGSKIFEITEAYDSLALEYLRSNPNCKYIFLSSGAVYNSDFKVPATSETCAVININNLQKTDWYSIAKLHAEARHRSMSEYSIIDLRVFNYFSHTQDMNAKFFITDVVRAIKNNEVFKTTHENIVRDYITPTDFFNLIQCLIKKEKLNLAIDCRTESPIDKLTLLKDFHERYKLKYSFIETTHLNPTGFKENYYSIASGTKFIEFRAFFNSLQGLIFEINKIF